MRFKKHPYRHNLAMRSSKIRIFFVLLFAFALAGSSYLLFKNNKTSHTTIVTAPTSSTQQNRAISDQNDSALAHLTLYNDPNSKAAQQAKVWQTVKPVQAAAMERLAALPSAHWLTSQSSLSNLKPFMQASKQAGATPVLVAYNIPLRDCGLYSSGGSQNLTEYKQFINTMATAINDAQAIVIIEPDAIAGLQNKEDTGRACRNEQQRQETYQAIQYATTTLKKLPKVYVYIDAGNSSWLKDTKDLANRLEQAGIEQADGFSLNVSNFQTTEDNIQYGSSISKLLNGKHFVIDTSRNGVGSYKNKLYPAQTWCNPPDRALGHFPTIRTDIPYVDGFLFIKVPGESDGNDSDANKCFGGPLAGTWWPEYALGLVERWPKELQP